MIPLELKLSGVRAFGNHIVRLGGPEVREVVMFGPNGSGKSTIARMIQALVGDVPDDLQQSYLDERESRVNRRASAELTVLNQRGDDMWNPDWPEVVTLGLEFGYENNRSFSRYYTVADGKRQAYRTHEEYASVFRRNPFNIKPDDRFMFIQQGESAALVQMRPRQRYETMKQFLGLEDLERGWQETLDAKERAYKELREATAQHDVLEDGVKRKEIAANRLREYRQLSEELATLERRVADDDLVRLVRQIGRLRHEEERLAASLRDEKDKRESLQGEVGRAETEVARLTKEIDAAAKSLAEAKVRHARANEERAEAHRSVEDAEGEIGSLERIASEGLSEEALEREADRIQDELDDLEKRMRDGEDEKADLAKALEQARSAAAGARHAVQSMRAEMTAAEAVLSRTGPSERLAEDLAPARAALIAAREVEFAAGEQLHSCELAVRTLEENQTAMPPEAVAARDRYLARGTAAVILGDAVAPLNVQADERRPIEGALGDLRWAVLVEDGRILVDYREYTLAEFCPAPDATDERSAAPSASDQRGVTPDGPRTTCASKLARVSHLAPGLSGMLNTVLKSVVFSEDHESAALLASKGLTAYTPDGYRYDRYGRKYSVPATLCVGRSAYEAAVKEARDALNEAKDQSARARRARTTAEDLVGKLEAASREATEAEARVARIESSLPNAVAELSRLDDECSRLSGDLDAVESALTVMKVQQALSMKEAEDVRGKLERVRKLADLPRMRQELTGLRDREATARRAADAALEESRGLEAGKEAAERQSSILAFNVQRMEERLGDLVPRIADLERDLEEKRRDVREAEGSAPTVADRWRKATGKTEMSDQEVLLHGDELLETVSPASEGERVSWTSRVAEVRPTVEALKDDVIPTAEEDYLSAKQEFDKAENQLRRVDEAFRDASDREDTAQGNFKKVMQETFGRVSSRFQGYLSKFGWTGYLNVEPVQGTQFDLQIYLSVYEGIEPRPLLRNRSGGETSAVAALLTLAMVKEYRRPFYIFDEIDQSLDPANVLKLAAILRQELDRKYIVISHRLNKAHLEQGQFGIGVYRSQTDGSRTRIYRRKGGPVAS